MQSLRLDYDDLMKLSKITVCCSLFLLLPYCLRAQAENGHPSLESLRHFVKGFYNWYVPKAVGDSSSPPWKCALGSRNTEFDPRLAQALKEDVAAQAKADGDLVGLDFDPFLNSQDPADHYVVGKIGKKGETYWADVYGRQSGRTGKKPVVVAALIRHGGYWQFKNFYYPDHGGNLLAVLKSLRKERRSPIAAPPASVR